MLPVGGPSRCQFLGTGLLPVHGQPIQPQGRHAGISLCHPWPKGNLPPHAGTLGHILVLQCLPGDKFCLPLLSIQDTRDKRYLLAERTLLYTVPDTDTDEIPPAGLQAGLSLLARQGIVHCLHMDGLPALHPSAVVHQCLKSFVRGNLQLVSLLDHTLPVTFQYPPKPGQFPKAHWLLQIFHSDSGCL